MGVLTLPPGVAQLRRRLTHRRGKKSPVCPSRPGTSQIEEVVAERCSTAGSQRAERCSTAGSQRSINSRTPSRATSRTASKARDTKSEVLTARLSEVSERLAEVQASQKEVLSARKVPSPGSSLDAESMNAAFQLLKPPGMRSRPGTGNTPSAMLGAPSRRRRPVVSEADWAASVLDEMPSARRVFEEQSAGLRLSQSAPSLDPAMRLANKSGLLTFGPMAKSGGLPYTNDFFDYLSWDGSGRIDKNDAPLPGAPLPGGELPPVKTVKRGRLGVPLQDNSKIPSRDNSKGSSNQLKHRISIDSAGSCSSDRSERKTSKTVKVAREPMCLAGMAIRWKMPLETVQASSELFRKYAEPLNAESTGDILRDGRLAPAALSSCACSLAGVTSLEELCSETGEECLIPAGYLNFEGFAAWYNRRAFSNYVNLPKDCRECRHVAQALGIPVAEAERCKSIFDKFDADRNGFLDFEEFGAFVNSLMGKKFDSRKNANIPANRIEHMWMDCAHNAQGNDKVTFQEFATYYSHQFDPDSFDPGDSLGKGLYNVRSSCLMGRG